ncbi:MAG: acyl-CoA thioesterase [Acidobacteriota bacterium]|jgi:acyl-CoA thioesterase-1
MTSLFRRASETVPLAVCLLMAGAFACSRTSPETAVDRPPAAASPAPDTRPKVIVLGDSLTAGLGLVPTESFPAVLQRRIDDARLPFDVVNAGVSGDTSAGGLRRLDWSLQDGARVLVLALGANDGLRGLPVRELKRNLASVIERAQAKGIVVVLAGMEAPPNYGAEYATAFRQAYRDLAKQYHVPLVPFLLDRVAGQPGLNQADGIHPNVRGAQIVADTVWAVLKPELERLSAS